MVMNVLRTGGAGSPPAAVVQGADADGSGLTEQGYPPGESPSIFYIRSSFTAVAAAAPRPFASRRASTGLRFSTHGRGAGRVQVAAPNRTRDASDSCSWLGCKNANEGKIMAFGGNIVFLALC